MAMAEQWFDGVLVKRWNETNKRVETMNPNGTVASFVPMTPEESAEADAYLASKTATTNEATVKTNLEADLTAMQSIIDQSNADLRADPSQEIKLIARAMRRLIRAELNKYDGTD